MKRSLIRGVALCAALIMLVCCLSACSRISGTYSCDDDIIYTSYTFSLFSDKLVYTVIEMQFNGTYEINGDTITITIAGDSQEHSYSKEGSTIYIDGKAYTKE